MSDFLKKNCKKIIIAAVIIAALTAAFFIGGDSDTPSLNTKVTSSDAVDSMNSTHTGNNTHPDETTDINTSQNAQNKKSNTVENKTSPSIKQSSSSKNTDNTADTTTKSTPSKKKTTTTKKSSQLSCTISISCSTIKNNMGKLDKNKASLIPSDGWILKKTTVVFSEGESVFNVLQRVCKNKKIHFEYTYTPLYNSAYIEGIGNIYEFDCGSLSGWVYSVNSNFPNYSCSKYSLKNGDKIEVKYTCNLGEDTGGNNY